MAGPSRSRGNAALGELRRAQIALGNHIIMCFHVYLTTGESHEEGRSRNAAGTGCG
jgi:hypothetical protein